MLQRGPGTLLWNRSHPQPHRGWSSHHPIPCLPHRVLLRPWHLHPAVPPTCSPIGPPSVQPLTPTRRRGLTWQSRCLSRSPALAERGTTCPRGGLYPSLRGAGQGRAPNTELHHAPSGRRAGQTAASKGEVSGTATQNVVWDENGLKGTARNCRERWRESREMWLLLAGRKRQRWACGSRVPPALCCELASGLRPEVFGRQGCGRRQHCKAFRISVKGSGKAQPPHLIGGKTGLQTR